MNPSIGWRRCQVDLELRRQRFQSTDVGFETMHVGRSWTRERERYRVRSRIAAFQMRRTVLVIGDDTVMLVRRETVVVLRVIVVPVDMGVQQGYCPRRRDQRRNEQQRQRTVHDDESMGRGQLGSKSRRGLGHLGKSGQNQ